MSREIKVFEVSVNDTEEPIAFSLTFLKKSDGSSVTHDFEVMADPGAGAPMAMSGLVRYDDRGKQMVDLNALKVFFRRVMDDDNYERFIDLLDSKDVSLPMDTLTGIFSWLMEEYSGRPTMQSSSSANGRRKTGARSTGQPSLTVAT